MAIDHAEQRPLVVIAGATATGKSDLALDVAEAVGGEIINVDALQFYRGMDIGTAKLPALERRGIAHHLLDILTVREEASVAEFQAQARGLVAEIRARGRVPVAVGGSGLYIRALTDRLEFPPSDPSVRARLEQEAREIGAGALHARLVGEDPTAAAKINVADERRIVRALEVIAITGRPFSAFLPAYEFADPNVVYTAVSRERGELHERVERRVQFMMEQGFLVEVERLLDEGIEEGKTARQAIGYAQMIDHVRGRLSRDEAIESTVVGTRKLVRKQDTWFRRDPRFTWLDGTDRDAARAQVEALIAQATSA